MHVWLLVHACWVQGQALNPHFLNKVGCKGRMKLLFIDGLEAFIYILSTLCMCA